MSKRTVLAQYLQDQRCATKPLDIQVLLLLYFIYIALFEP